MKEWIANSCNHIKEGIFISALLSFLLFFFAPMMLFLMNAEDYPFDVYLLLPIVLIVWMIIFFVGGILFAVVYKISVKGYKVMVFIAMDAFVMFYIQGTFLIRNLPIFDGNEIDWNSYKSEDVRSIVILCIVTVVLLLVWKKLHYAGIKKMIQIGSVCIFLILFITLLVTCFSNDSFDRKEDCASKNYEFEMSTERNYIVLILDTMDAAAFSEVLTSDESYNDVFEDFTYYENTVGAYAYTDLSIPLILGGERYDYKKSYNEYVDLTIQNSPILSELEKNGYRLGYYEESLYIKGKENRERFENIVPKGTVNSYPAFAKNIVLSAGIQYAPFCLKKYCYQADADSYKRLFTVEEAEPFTWNNEDFYRDVLNENITYTSDKCFKYIHLEGAHPFFHYDKDMNRIEDGTYQEMLEANITLLKAYLQKLKDSNVYDNSVIIIMGDHGYSEEMNDLGRSNPILFVKGIEEKHPLNISNAPISYDDLQDAYKKLLNEEQSENIFPYEEGDIRERLYIPSVGDPNNPVEGYYQVGHASDLSTLEPTGQFYKVSYNATIEMFNRFLLNIMEWCYECMGNYCLAIVFFTLLTKVLMLPITVWVQKNSIKMVQMTPELNRIQIQYFGDGETISEEKMKLFKKMKYTPMASIIPIIFQLVLLVGVVAAVREGMKNPAINMLWLSVDCSTVPWEQRGRYLSFPLIAGVSALLMCMAQNKSNVLQAEQSKWNQNGTMLFSVVLSLYLGCFVPAGVAVYWTAGNLMSIMQMYLLNIVVNPKKYVDYELLEESKRELEALKQFGKTDGRQKKELTRREKKDYKRFFSIGNKHLVFYSEESGFYKYYKGTIEYILQHTNLAVHYITSDPEDVIFTIAKEQEQIKAYYIGERRLITLMMKMDVDIVVLTMPDLNQYHIKRSYVRDDIEYIHLMHGMDSVNATYRKGSLDYFDTVFCTGPHQKEEVEKIEKAYELPEKNLVEWGYSLLDEMREEYDGKERKSKDKLQILIAPSWQKDNIMESCINELAKALNKDDYHVIIRPHPQYVRHNRERLAQLSQKYTGTNVEIQSDFSSNQIVFESDLLITDWSSICYEFAFTTRKPVLFVNTPMKVMNPEYKKIDVEPINVWMREEIGACINLDNVENAGEIVETLLEQREFFWEKIERFTNENVYHLGNSAEIGAKYILSQLEKKFLERKKSGKYHEKNS